MSSNQHSAVPEAGSTRLFQITCGCRPVRQRTSHAHASVPTSATSENDGTKPGARRATFSAGLAGMPVCSDSQITQIVIAHALKKTSENQSIRADALRLNVGS